MACTSRKARLEYPPAGSSPRRCSKARRRPARFSISSPPAAPSATRSMCSVASAARWKACGPRPTPSVTRARRPTLTLSANVVNTSIARAAYAAQIRATEQLIELENQQLHLAETQFRAGTAPYSTVLSVRSLIAANQALLAPLEQNASQAEHLLATLEGRGAIQSELCLILTWPNSRCRRTCR